MKLNHLVLATTLVALAACTDYLDDFQDKYDNGNAFAEISSDSELSSSSKGNDDADSSSSKSSSSSVADQENLCKGGTVIYDYKVQGKLGFDLQFFRAGYSSTLPENERGIDFSSLTENDYAGFQWNGSYDVSSWKGICIEYTTDKDVSLYLGDSKKTEKVNLSANDNFKEIKWDDPAYKENISFNDFRKFFFDFSDEINMVISRITTIAKVDTSVNSPTLDTISCTGSIIYDASEVPNYNVFGYGFVVDHYSEKKASSNGITSNLSQNGSLIMPLAAKDKSINIQSWDGFCVEYLSEGSITTEIVSPFVGKKALIYKEMPNTNGEKSSFRWSWNENEGLMEKQKDNGVSDGFSIEKVESINFTSHSSNSTITIHKITTLNSDVHFKCDGLEIFPKGKKIFQVFNNWSSSGQKMGVIYPSDDKYEIPLSGGNSVAPNNEEAFKQELANAHGFCMEYSSDNYFLLSLTQYVDGNQKKTYAKREVGKGNQRVVFVLWDELKEQFTNFDPQEKHMLELSAPQNGVEATNITISRMTLLQ